MRGTSLVAALILGIATAMPLTAAVEENTSPEAADLAGVCARCHDEAAALAAETGGHAPGISCEDCHRERRAGRFGRRHRTVVSCASHHDETGHPAKRFRRAADRKRKLIRNCVTCHEPHGSANLSLVQQKIRTGRQRLTPVRFDNRSGAAPGSFADPAMPGRGLCEMCHRRTKFYRRKDGGQAHFSGTCVGCHDHQAGFRVAMSELSCPACHVTQGSRFEKPSRHSANFACSGCHVEVAAEAGPGHRRVPGCTECHTGAATHAPSGTGALSCTQCHDPHGTDNITLVREEIVTPQGQQRAIAFDNQDGRAEGSFASASVPGSGICEVCHTTTVFYRADGAGADHFESSCLTCHQHVGGFIPSFGAEGPSCTICHAAQGNRFEKPSRHSTSFACTSCHVEVSAVAGPGHRRLPGCGECHTGAATHAPSGTGALSCTQCHDPHGTDNITLVREEIVTPQGQQRAIAFDNPDGRAEGSFASASVAGSGICEVCHTTTTFYRADGTGTAHLESSCVACHPHSVGFIPSFGPDGPSCTICHAAQGNRFEKASRHSTSFACTDCHVEVSAVAGPGHRRVPACDECHTGAATHAPSGAGALSCTQCHDPHGTDNITLVREEIVTPQGQQRAIAFDNPDGRAEGSFASASVPGSGICEVCHTATGYFRSDGTGGPHFDSPCMTCHQHFAHPSPETGALPCTQCHQDPHAVASLPVSAAPDRHVLGR